MFLTQTTPQTKERANAVRASLWSATLQIDSLISEMPQLAPMRETLMAMQKEIGDEANRLMAIIAKA